MRTLIFGLVQAAALIVAVIPANAGEALRSASFCFNDWPPYTLTVDGKASGLSVDILREAARRAGVLARFIELPWKRCLQLVETGEIDAVIDAAERPQFIHGSISFTVYTNTFWVRGDDALARVDEAALVERRLGLVTGYAYGDVLERMFSDSGVSIDHAVDDEMLVRKLVFDRTDIIIADFVSTRLLAISKGLDVRPMRPAHSLDRLYPSFNRDRHALMLAIDAGLATMCADGSIQGAYFEALGFGLDDIVVDHPCVPVTRPAG